MIRNLPQATQPRWAVLQGQAHAHPVTAILTSRSVLFLFENVYCMVSRRAKLSLLSGEYS